MAQEDNVKRIEEARKLAKDQPQKAEATYKDILSKPPGQNDKALRDFESALTGLGELYRDHKRTQDLVSLIEQTRNVLTSFARAKTAKLVRQLLDLLAAIPKTTDTQITVTKSSIEWAVSQKQGFLRQSLEVRLVNLYMQTQAYYDALTLINNLLKELKRLDDKLVLVEVQLLESKVYHALGNIPKGRAALTSARTSAASVYTPPLLQAGLDMQSGQLHAEDGDFNTAFSYFIEAMEGYHGLDDATKATAALQYMLLCKIMLNLKEDVDSLMTSKHAIKYAGKNLDAMKAVARAHNNRSLEEYEQALHSYRYELGGDRFIASHLRRLYDSMLEQNLIKVIEPFSRVEITHVAKMVGLDVGQVERKLAQMILDRVIIGIVDQGQGVLEIFEEAERDKGYDAALDTIGKLGSVVDVLYTNQASLLE
ncbi:PCI-domain-containing protein [Sphaerulina musiva SO2202]|uniref:PCI-domain-containing protein n=1 Tax=Sphaerulina musiva (strain SO2202) TaxID=692275 RepID=M3CGG1_SPHMS|nr:PCI-domain-containing protein [Sphaerulina musiva SO2202]EMF12878.1 PCI-domain-containing protein [Sphaerulina musiva SO2202]